MAASVPVTRTDLPALYDEHYRSLVKLAAMYLDDVETAEEVVQDAFVKRPGLVAAAEDSGVASMDRIGMLARIRRLPKKQSDVLILRYYVQLSEREIATTLGIAPGSVKSHASRALKKLRDEMKDDRP